MTKSVFTDAYATMRELLVVARTDAGVTQVDLARRIGWTQTKVSQVERGVRRIDVIEFCAIARAIGSEPNALFASLTARLPGDLKI